MLPSVDFAAQYGLLAEVTTITRTFFSREVSSAITPPSESLSSFPSFSPTQHARAEAADATALKSKEGCGRRQESGFGGNSQAAALRGPVGRGTGSCGSRIPGRTIGSGIAAGSAWTPEAPTGTTSRTRANSRANVTILYRMRISNCNGPGSACLRATGELEAGSGWQSKGRSHRHPSRGAILPSLEQSKPPFASKCIEPVAAAR